MLYFLFLTAYIRAFSNLIRVKALLAEDGNNVLINITPRRNRDQLSANQRQSLTSAKLPMVKVTKALLYCKEYLTGLCGLKREARHPTETNADKKTHLHLTLTSKPHVPSGTLSFMPRNKTFQEKKTAY